MGIFNTEGKLYKGLTWIGNIAFLNLCWLLFSLPIITIGASTTAAYSMIFKIMDDKEGYLFKGFVKEFTKNWKQGTILWVLTLLAGYGIYMDIQFLVKTDPGVGFIILSIVGIVVLLAALLYAYPLSAKYKNMVFAHLKNSFLLAAHFPLRTLLLMVIVALEVAAMMWNFTTMILILIIGPMILITTIAGTAKKIFQINEKRNKENGWKPTVVDENGNVIEDPDAKSDYAENMEVLDATSLKGSDEEKSE